jgi:hypothetical protein
VKLYTLKVNGNVICEVSMDVPSRLPMPVQLDPVWLRGVVAEAVRTYFHPGAKLESQPLVKV